MEEFSKYEALNEKKSYLVIDISYTTLYFRRLKF